MTLPLHLSLIAGIPPLVVAVVLHEVAHGWVAEKLGDPTARRMGRITLNPLKHIDPVMTVAVPAMLILLGSPIVFGGAKPVPVNPAWFRNPRKGMLWVALAGPVTNFILVSILLVFWSAVTWSPTVITSLPKFIQFIVYMWILQGILINLVLGLFNLIPVPPLDGGRIAVGLLPQNYALKLAKLEPYGLFIVVFLLYLGILDVIIEPVVNLVTTWLSRGLV